eukprot:COSAG05_NODE_11556_length_508_cov_0.552567_1_plen_21_part_10
MPTVPHGEEAVRPLWADSDAR